MSYGGAPYFQDEWYGYRWQVAAETLRGMTYQRLTDGGLAAIGAVLQTAVAAWETEAMARVLTTETTTEENNG